MKGLGAMMALCLAGLAAEPAVAEVYRWTDQHGRVHFGDRPPDGQGEQVDIAPPPAAESAPRPQAVPDRQRMLDMYQREREERQAAKAEEAKARSQRQRDCQRLARNLRRYQAGGPVYEPLPDGGRRYYTAAEKDEEMAEMRAQLDKYCGGVPVDSKAREGR